MKIKKLLIGIMASILCVTACQQADFGAASLEVSASSLTLPLEGGNATFTLTTSRDWTINVEALKGASLDGVAVSPANGKPSHDKQVVTVSAGKNNGKNRQFVLVVKASTYVKEIVVSQKGVLGNQMSVDEVMSSEAGTELTVRNALVYGINERGFVMGDDTGLILVYNESMTLVKDVKAGDKIDIEGTVGSYGIAQILPTRITVLSSGNEIPQLDPTVITKDNISMADRTMVNYVEMEGIYVKSGDYNNIKVIGSTISGSISYPIADLGLADMVGQVIKVRGFYSGGTSEYYYNILVTEILEHKDLDAETYTAAQAHEAATDALVKVQGTVMGVHEKGLVLGDDTGVIYVYTNTTPEAKIGNTVTIIALKSVNYGVHQLSPLKITVDDASEETPSYGTPVDLTTLEKLNAYNVNADKVATDYVEVRGVLDGLNVTYAAENGVAQNKMPLMNYTIDSYEFLTGKAVTVFGYVVSYNGSKTPPNMGILVVKVDAEPYLFVGKGAVTALPDETSAEILVQSNVAWTATTAAEWLTISPAGATGDGTLTLSFSEYEDTSVNREAVVVISAEGLDPVEVKFTQTKAVEGGKLAEYDLVGWNFDGSNWDSSYAPRTISFDLATIKLAAANKQASGNTITDCPVTKGGDIEVIMAEGKEMVSITVYLKQWGTKTQTAKLYPSTDGGANYAEEAAVESKDFTLSATTLPAGTNAVKVGFSNKSNQVGLAKISIVYKDKE